MTAMGGDENRQLTILTKAISEAKWFTKDKDNFKGQLRQYWFHKYSRSDGVRDSSGFEHIFQGEIRVGGLKVTGFHSWLQTYLTEQNKQFVYGHSDNDCGDGLVRLNDFTYKEATKAASSTWIGRSVELEFGLYSVYFMARQDKRCNISVGKKAVTIINFKMEGVDPVTIGSVYPEC